MKHYKINQQLSLVILIIGCCLLTSSQVKAQGKQAIVILRPTSADASNAGCEGAAELTDQILYDAKLNAKDEIRLLNSGGGASSTISRDAYDHSGKSKMRDLVALKWGRDGVLYAVSVAGQAPIMALPDNMKPQKNVGSEPLSAFYGVMLSGEARDGKQKRKVELALRAIWKVYFLAEGASVNDTLFNHVAEEASVALWEAYLQKTNNYRASEANAKMRDALVACARVDLDRFAQGDYGSLDKARQKATRAQSVKDDESTRRLVADIRSAQQQVEDARNKAEQLIKAEKWDDAIDATEPIRKYLDTWPDLNRMYSHALEASHEIHLNAGDKAFLANQLEASLSDCSIARSRLPNSERALSCVCRARNEIALRDSKKDRQIKKPKDAKELLEKQLVDSDCKQDPRLVAELKVSKCEYAQQLYAEARQSLGVGGGAARPTGLRRRGAAGTPAQPANSNVNVKLITMQNKKDFRDSREKLLLASEMCGDSDIQSLLATTNRHLSEFCITEARKALQRNDNGTAYVYLQKAQGYALEDSSVSQLLVQAKEKFQEQTRVNVGVAFVNRSGNGNADGLLNEVAAGVESASTEAGLAQPTVLGREGAVASLRAIQGGRPVDSPTVIFFGELLTAGARVERNSYSVSSSFSYPNPERQQWDRNIDAKNNELDNCKKQYGDAGCAGVRAERDRMRAYRDSLPRSLQQAYSYTQTDFRLQGAARMSFRSTDSISRGTGAADTLADEVGGQCQQREGVHDNDTRGASNNMCRVDDEGTYLSQMFNKIRNEAHLRAVESLRGLPSSYYRRAQSSANKQQAIEGYLRFLFLTSNKSGSEAEQAKAFLIAYDPELSTDGVLR
jgi:hypothetical protein